MTETFPGEFVDDREPANDDDQNPVDSISGQQINVDDRGATTDDHEPVDSIPQIVEGLEEEDDDDLAVDPH